MVNLTLYKLNFYCHSPTDMHHIDGVYVVGYHKITLEKHTSLVELLLCLAEQSLVDFH